MRHWLDRVIETRQDNISPCRSRGYQSRPGSRVFINVVKRKWMVGSLKDGICGGVAGGGIDRGVWILVCHVSRHDDCRGMVARGVVLEVLCRGTFTMSIVVYEALRGAINGCRRTRVLIDPARSKFVLVGYLLRSVAFDSEVSTVLSLVCMFGER